MRRFTALLTGITLFIGACSADTVDDGPTTTGTNGPSALVGSVFRVFDTCDDLLAYYQANALEMVGPWGLDAFPVVFMDDATEMALPADGGAATPSARVTGTNNQIAGVDEADIVKTDGARIFTITDGVFRVLTVGTTVELRGRIQLDWWPQAMLLHGDSVLLIGQVWGGGGISPLEDRVGIAPQYQSTVTRLMQIDVSDPDRPRVGATLDMDGTYVSARLVDGIARLAITSSPVGIEWAYPDGSGIRAEREATEANREIIRNTTLDNWLPYYVYQGDGIEREGRLLDCTKVMAPNEFSGLETLSLLTFDLASGLQSWADAAVVASGSTMYATEDHVYLATQRWVDWRVLADTGEIEDAADGFRTQIHLFDTTDPGAPRYMASGEVRGFLLNQFSLDEHDGVLRVATTSQPTGWGFSTASESQVVTLRRDGDRLESLGMVGGLGKGEQIYSVRFMGDLGYVVTFRQTDPLYVIDLSDPASPAAVGELKINGYSAYLHPVGEGRLLGLGQDATDEGRRLGTQLSLFDVTDPANPQRLDTVSMDGGWSAVEGDHHAFTFVDGLVLAPFESWIWGPVDGDAVESGRFDTGVMAVRVEGDRLTLADILRPMFDGPIDEKDLWETGNDPWRMVPLRTIVIGDRIFTITNGGVAIHDFSTYQRLDVVEF
jgi:hypothetical protein